MPRNHNAAATSQLPVTLPPRDFDRGVGATRCKMESIAGRTARAVHAVCRRGVFRADDQGDAVDRRQAGVFPRRARRRSVSGPARSAAGRAPDRSQRANVSPSRCSSGSFRSLREAKPQRRLTRLNVDCSFATFGRSVPHTMNDNWETEIAELLAELADVQSALLGVLAEKRQILATSDHAGAVGDGRARAAADRPAAGVPRAAAAAAWLGPRPKGCRLIAFARSAIACQPESRGRVQASIRRSGRAVATSAAPEPYELGASTANAVTSFAVDRDYCYRRPAAADIWKWLGPRTTRGALVDRAA